MTEESGQPVALDECRRCGGKKVTGLRYFWEGGWEFKCDQCGRTMLLGYDEETTSKQVEEKHGWERAEENRVRYHREIGVKFDEEVEKAKENLESEPDMFEAFAPMFEKISFAERDARRFGSGKKFDEREIPFNNSH